MDNALKFLVVEDDAAIRFLRRKELEKRFPGCRVTECESAEDAVARSGAGAFSAVITDHKLPDRSGSELIAQLRRQGVTCPVVMVTGSDDPVVHRSAYEAGASRVLFGSRPAFADALTALLSDKGAGTG